MKYPGEESNTLEFKSQPPKNEQIIKTVIGFCNQHGGKIILGVEDNGEICGIEENKAIALIQELEHSIYKASSPPIIAKVYLQHIGEHILLIIEVSEGMNKPYFRTSEGLEQGTYLRMGENTVRASPDMIQELQWHSRGIAYENTPMYQADENELDKKQLSQFLKNRRQKIHADLNQSILLSYKLLAEEHRQYFPTVAGILLFGTRVQYHLPEAMIICSHFKGISGREAIAAVDCEGTLFQQFEQAYHFIVSRLHHSFKIKDVLREEQLEVPAVAIREVLMNAIVHRNYFLRAPSKVAIYDDRIEIFSPGNFPTPFPNLHLGLTDARNMSICRVFREANLIEKLGTGFITMFESYQQWGLPEPTVIDGAGFVKCILPRSDHHADTQIDEHKRILALYEAVDALSVSDVMSLLHMPRSTATRKLSELVELGMLNKIGKGKATRYVRHRKL